MLTGRVLDVGCYTGFLYHYLGKPAGYTGVDTWQEAIDVAREFAPEADFRVLDGLEVKETYDVIWSSQILWNRGAGPRDAIEKLRKIAKTLIMVLAHDEARYIEDCRPIEAGKLQIFIYEGSC